MRIEPAAISFQLGPFRRILGVAAVAVACLGATSAQPVLAQSKLPQSLTITAYDTGTSGFNITVAVGKALKDKYGTEVRVLPAGNDVARIGPLKAGRAQMSSMGVGSYFAQEAVFEFASRDWGPQALQLMLSSIDCNGANLGIAADTGAKELKDLKGKRVGAVVGSPALTQNALGMLAFAGLTRDDVKMVEFASFGAMWKGMINNEVDAAFASTITANTRELETSPRGLIWPTLPHADQAGWSRLAKIAPFFTKHSATCGSAGLSASTPKEMGTFPYPMYVAYGTQPADSVYALTKAMIDTYELYKDGAPGATGLAIQKQTTQWVIPFHSGAVQAFKEAGIWKDADDKHNASLIARQGVLRTAWEAFSKANPPEDGAAFAAAWSAARREGLIKAGMEPIM